MSEAALVSIKGGKTNSMNKVHKSLSQYHFNVHSTVLGYNTIGRLTSLTHNCICISSTNIPDERRAVVSISVSPLGDLSVCVDGFGRVLLLENHSMTLRRMWKGTNFPVRVCMVECTPSVTILLAGDPLSSLGYFPVSHTPPIA